MESSSGQALAQGGEPNSPQNWRPIALTSCLGKLLHTIIAARITEYATTEGIMDTTIQKGFLPKLAGCVEHTAALSHCIRHPKKNRKPLCMVQYDLANAFGSVPHEIIIAVLKRAHIDPVIIHYIRKLYENAEIQLKLESGLTESIVNQSLNPFSLFYLYSLSPRRKPMTRRRRGHRGSKDSDTGINTPSSSTSGRPATTPLRRGSSPHPSVEVEGLRQLSIEELKKASPDLVVRVKEQHKSCACDFCGLPFVPTRRDNRLCEECVTLRSRHRNDVRVRASTQASGTPPPSPTSSSRSSRANSTARRIPRSSSSRGRSRSFDRTFTTVAPTPILRKAANVSFAPLPTPDSRSTSYARISTPGLATAPSPDHVGRDVQRRPRPDGASAETPHAGATIQGDGRCALQTPSLPF